jgi:queuine tRNA-ribosyltransferase
MEFKVEYTDKDSGARSGTLTTRHGQIKTPVFMPVGTAGSVKALTVEQLQKAGAQIILANTYHLFLRPGLEVIEKFSGLHDFIGWPGPILTDSGGFQLYSLGAYSKVTPEGVAFKSHLDGSRFFLSPEEVVDIQHVLNSDIQMVLDHFAPYPATHKEDGRALTITLDWARRARRRFLETNGGNAQFAIIQGGLFEDLREHSLKALVELGFEGYALGGLSVGEPSADFERIVSFLLPHMPVTNPRYLMGSGTPEEILLAVDRGVDMFDCVLPTRNARRGTLFTSRGKLSIKNQRFKLDESPLDPDCSCYACRNFSRAYLRHLYLSKEIGSAVLNTIHNIHFYLDFMSKIGYAIELKGFKKFKEAFLTLYNQGV